MPLEEWIKDMVVKYIGEVDDWRFANDVTCSKEGFVERKNIIAKCRESEFKFLECTCWDENKPVCVGVGYNPRESNPNNIDKTNKKIINLLKENDYGKYILLNLYPKISKCKKDLNKLDLKNCTFNSKVFPKLLDEIIERKDVSVVIFWRREVEFNNNIYRKLVNLQKDGNLYCTVKKKCKKKLHYHPRNGVDDFVLVKDDNFMHKIV